MASVTRLDGRDIVEGRLGCPVCRRQFVVQGGEIDFDESSAGAEASTPVGGGEGSRAPEGSPQYDADDSAHLRRRALLALAEGGGVVLLGGECAAWAPALEDDAQVLPLLLNAPRHGAALGRHPSALRSTGVLPMAPGSLRAAWVDAATASPAMLESVVRALRAGGRLVAPVHVPVPAGVRELARDAEVWVAERTESAAGPPVQLRRR